jgi:hypothetical protein
MNFIKKYRIQRAIRKFILKLPTLLAKDYGKRNHYTPMQIKATLDRYSIASPYILYAFAIFAHRDSFYQHSPNAGIDVSIESYDQMREVVADHYFSGDTNFDASSFATTIYSETSFSGIDGGEGVGAGETGSD